MKKTVLLVSLIISLMYLETNAQNYYGSQFVGDSGVNSPQRITKLNDGGYAISTLLGGSLTGDFPITHKGGNADGALIKLSQTGAIEWIKQFGGGLDEVLIDTAQDSDGNYYLTGYFMGAGSNALDADPSDAVVSLSVTSTFANRDVFLIKLDAAGDFVWAKQMSSPSGGPHDDVSTIKIDANGNIYLAGSYVYLDFDPGAAEEIHIATGSSDSFIVKLDNDGNFIWVKTLDGTSNKKIMNMDLDENGNIYVVGRFQGTIDLDPDDATTDIRTTAGSYDTFVAKYDVDGNYIWGLNYGSTGSDTPEKILVNGTDLYVGGGFNATVDLDPSSTGTNSFTSAGGQEAYISKFTTEGTYVNSFVIPGTTSNLDTIKDIVITDDGSLVLAGLFQNITLDGNNYAASATNADAYYLKLDSSLNFSSIYLIQGVQAQSNPFVQTLDATKFIGIGSSRGVAAFDYTNPSTTEGNATPQSFVYITKFDFEATLNAATFNAINDLLVYPNPVQSTLNINSKNKIVALDIYNLQGRKVFSQVNTQIVNADVTILPSGTYILQVKDENGTIATQKLIKL
ncbi:T9SS type A sorting domain-containing protein [Flavobacterium sp.]|uniref:T9SS type A sorting domain-containing protein n=1 Tax=Flavobacterium sp. TaxID=239 RepID=UPI003529611E